MDAITKALEDLEPKLVKVNDDTKDALDKFDEDAIDEAVRDPEKW